MPLSIPGVLHVECLTARWENDCFSM